MISAKQHEDFQDLARGALQAIIPQTISRARSMNASCMIFLAFGSPRAGDSAKWSACSSFTLGGSGGVSGSTIASRTAGPGETEDHLNAPVNVFTITSAAVIGMFMLLTFGL
jgi:hypothetical protein